MKWTRITPIGGRHCASFNCSFPARWHGESGDGGSDYCSMCRDAIDGHEIMDAARMVVAYDWSDSDADAAAAIERLRQAVNRN